MLKREIKINYKSLLIWTISLSVVYALIYAIYPSLMNEESAKAIADMIASMPEEVLAAFNMDIIGIEDAYGWFKTEGYVFLTLVGSVYASILGATILLKEENDKTIEFLYSKPIPRHQIVTSKIICGGLNILFFTIVIFVVNLLTLKLIDVKFDMNEFLMVSFIPLLLFYLIFFITLFISTFMKKTKKAMSIGMGFVFIEYFMQIIGGMGDKISFIRDLSLFEFASVRYISENQAINLMYLGIGCFIILTCISLTYVRYQHKEFI